MNKALDQLNALKVCHVQTITHSHRGNPVICMCEGVMADHLLQNQTWINTVVKIILKKHYMATGDHTHFYAKLCGVPTQHPKTAKPMCEEEVLTLLIESHPALASLDWMGNLSWMATTEDLIHKTSVSITFPFGNEKDQNTFLAGNRYFVIGHPTNVLKFNE